MAHSLVPAVSSFGEALEFVEGEEGPEATKLKMQCHLNLASCYMQMGLSEFVAALSFADAMLISHWLMQRCALIGCCSADISLADAMQLSCWLMQRRSLIG